MNGTCCVFGETCFLHSRHILWVDGDERNAATTTDSSGIGTENDEIAARGYGRNCWHVLQPRWFDDDGLRVIYFDNRRRDREINDPTVHHVRGCEVILCQSDYDESKDSAEEIFPRHRGRNQKDV